MKKRQLIFLSLFFLMVSFGNAAEQNMIAIAAEGKTPNSKVNAIAARSPYFLVFDQTGKFLEAVDNPYKAAKGGAGYSVVPFLAQRGVTIIVAGEFGDNMIKAMNAQGIKYVKFRGSVGEALQKVLEIKK